MAGKTPDPLTPLADALPEAASEAPGRREFLKLSAAAASASLLSACVGDNYQPATQGLPEALPLQKFEHLVVVMFENRSLDNTLGYLYEPNDVPRNQTFNGLAGTTHSNPVPPYIRDGHTSVTARKSPGTDADYSNPNPDPGEEYQHVNTQLYTAVDPPANEFRSATQMLPPYNAPGPGQPATMTGFVQDYCNNFVANQKRNPTFAEYRVIMDSFTSEQLPVLSTLAREFAVYDAWFCAVPSQTFCNRSFFHASTSAGYVVNVPYTKWLETNASPTIFNRLEDAGLPWTVYYDAMQLVSLTGLIHAPALFPFWKTHFATMEDFYSDVANGTLPAYAFVEPRMLFNHNDMHPPVPTVVIDNIPIGATSDVRAGDLLLHQIYSAVRTSAAPSGSNALNTLMLVTFDEHGGTFDHVAPPAAAPPEILEPAGEKGFAFDRLGVRVPTIAISAYTQANTIVNHPVHHGAVIRTLCKKHGLSYLTERDRNAHDLSDAVNMVVPRAPATWPVTVPGPVPPAALETNPLSPGLVAKPLNELERHIVGLAMARFNGVEPTDAQIPTTVGAAYTLLAQITKGAFGRS